MITGPLNYDNKYSQLQINFLKPNPFKICYSRQTKITKGFTIIYHLINLVGLFFFIKSNQDNCKSLAGWDLFSHGSSSYQTHVNAIRKSDDMFFNQINSTFLIPLYSFSLFGFYQLKAHHITKESQPLHDYIQLVILLKYVFKVRYTRIIHTHILITYILFLSLT